MENTDFFSCLGAIGAIATVIALFPEKNRMAAFNFLKKVFQQVLNFFHNAVKTAELATIQATAPEGTKPVGTFRIHQLKPVCSVTITRDFPKAYTIFELSYEPEKEVFPFEKVRSNIPLYEASFGDFWKLGKPHVLRGAFEEDLAICDELKNEFTHNFSTDRSFLLVAPTTDVSGLSFTISGPTWLKAQTVTS